METIALYFEPVAKSYGLETIRGLVMVQRPFRLENARAEGLFSLPTATEQGRFAFVMLQADPGGQTVLYAVAAAGDIAAIKGALGREKPGIAGDWDGPPQAVEMVVFQGPHFYERYGIAAAALGKLRERKVGLLLAGFSGSMAYLVLPEGAAESAQAALAECLRLP